RGEGLLVVLVTGGGDGDLRGAARPELADELGEVGRRRLRAIDVADDVRVVLERLPRRGLIEVEGGLGVRGAPLDLDGGVGRERAVGGGDRELEARVRRGRAAAGAALARVGAARGARIVAAGGGARGGERAQPDDRSERDQRCERGGRGERAARG